MELEQVLESTREVVREVIAPQAAATDQGRWPEAGLRALQQAGLGGLVIPRRFGGPGHSLAALVQVCELIGSECASTALCFGMHCVGSAVIAAKATDRQRSLLEEIVAVVHRVNRGVDVPAPSVCAMDLPNRPRKMLLEVCGLHDRSRTEAWIGEGGHRPAQSSECLG